MVRLSAWRSAEQRALDFLQRGPLVRRRLGWRFGTARIADAVVDRLCSAARLP